MAHTWHTIFAKSILSLFFITLVPSSNAQEQTLSSLVETLKEVSYLVITDEISTETINAFMEGIKKTQGLLEPWALLPAKMINDAKARPIAIVQAIKEAFPEYIKDP